MSERGSAQAIGTVLVLGGTGKTGRRVVERLEARGVPVRVGSRAGQPRFDWDDRSTWESSLRGVASVYVAYQPDLAVPAAPPAIRALVEHGERSGVYLDGRNAHLADGVQRALGRAPRDFTAYARATAASGVWRVVEGSAAHADRVRAAES